MRHDGIACDMRGDGALLALISASTLILAGDQDSFTPLSLSEALAAAVPNATMDVMKGREHVC